jgi:tRNA modification GTPase
MTPEPTTAPIPADEADTIAAISTPLGEGGIGVVRVSGPRAWTVAAQVFRGASGTDPSAFDSHAAHYGRVVEPPGGETLDQCVWLGFRGPRSYTGEDVVELSCHGSNLVLIRVLEALRRSGARLAEPGEFTQRAFLNGRMDLASAEAVIDVIRARTDAALRVATRQLEGRLSQTIRGIREAIITLLAEIEAAIDFPDDVEAPPDAEIERRVEACVESAEALLATAEAGRLYREGAAVVIVGRPNVGKSSLLNALLRENRAIVTPVPGTTRDVIEEAMNLRGIPIRAIDTAGLRETTDVVEEIGVRRGRAEIEAADLVLFVIDAAEGWTPDDARVARELAAKKRIVVANKIDLLAGHDAGAHLRDLRSKVGTGSPDAGAASPPIGTSMVTGTGLEALEEAVVQALVGGGAAVEEVLVSNARHKARIEASIASLREALRSVEAGFEQAVVAIDLKIAAEALGEITGETVTEATISQIFARFCVGK